MQIKGVSVFRKGRAQRRIPDSGCFQCLSEVLPDSQVHFLLRLTLNYRKTEKGPQCRAVPPNSMYRAFQRKKEYISQVQIHPCLIWPSMMYSFQCENTETWKQNKSTHDGCPALPWLYFLLPLEKAKGSPAVLGNNDILPIFKWKKIWQKSQRMSSKNKVLIYVKYYFREKQSKASQFKSGEHV